MHFNPLALLVFATFCMLLIVALTSGSAALHVGEAVATVLIAIGIGGLARNRLRG